MPLTLLSTQVNDFGQAHLPFLSPNFPTYPMDSCGNFKTCWVISLILLALRGRALCPLPLNPGQS